MTKTFSPRTVYALVFLSHFTMITLEIAGFRLLGHTFGVSLYSWGAMIGIIMVAMGIGSLLGGWLADRNNGREWLATLSLLSGILLSFTVIGHDYILAVVSNLATIEGVLLSSLILFFPPVVPLAMIPPLVIKRQAKSAQLGYSAGSVWSLATCGDLFGILISVLYLIPHFGSRAVLYLCFVIILAFGVVGMMKSHKAYIIALLLLLLPLIFTTPSLPGIVYENESFYNYIYVQNVNGYLHLKLNQADLVHSRLPTPATEYMAGGYTDHVLVSRYYHNRPSNVLFLGSGAGNMIIQWQHYFPDDRITGVEIDPKVVHVARSIFNVTENEKTIMVVDDGRPFLHRSNEVYDIIIIDVYQGSAYAPFYMMTKEFFADVSRHLTSDGVLVINVFDLGEGELADAVANSVQPSFASVHIVQAGNRILFATKLPSEPQDIGESIPPDYPIDTNYAQMYTFSASPSIPTFTDDDSNIEALTYRMLKKYRNAR